MSDGAQGEGDATGAAEAIDPPRRSSLPLRIVEVFFAPGRLFESLRENPAWFGVLLVGGALTVVSMLLIPQELWVSAAREQLIRQGQEVPPSLAAGAGIMRMAALVGGTLFWFVWAFLLAGIVTLVFALVLGDRGRYVQYLSVVSHALVIGAVGGLLLVPLRVFQQDPSLNLSLGTFALFLQDGYAFRVLKLLDLFGLWGYGVMAVGVTKMDPQRGLGSALFFFYAFALAFALLFGIFGG
jgi:hypothetical protein